MKVAIVALLVIASAVAIPRPARNPLLVPPMFMEPPTGKIVGGSEVTPHSVPFQAALHLAGGYFCGASLISDQWVVTAAHCGELDESPEVVLGAHNINRAEPEQASIIGATTLHPNWNSFTLNNDIALIKLNSVAPLSSAIQPVALAPASAGSYAGEDAVATGWGKTSDFSGISSVLMTVTSQILDNAACDVEFGAGIPIYETHICLDGKQGRSTCNGDSGGPLTVGGVEVGLTSFGTTAGCEAGYPAAFTRISEFRDWITEVSGV